MKKAAILTVVTMLLTLAGCVRDQDITYPDTPSGNLEALYHIIDEKYCFVEEKGVDWDSIYEAAKPVADTMSRANVRGLFSLMASMLDRLNDGHVNLYSPFDVSRPKGWYEGYPSNYSSSLVSQYLGDYMTAGGLYYNKMTGHEEIGYIRYSSFQNSFSASNMRYVLSYFADCKGIVLDVRNNGGGSLEYAYRLASAFMDSTTQVGYWQHKTGKGHNDYSEMEPITVEAEDMPYKWQKEVVVLCNRQSYSATNMFVNCMRYAPRCLTVGGVTGGGGGMPMSYELPNGWMIRFSSVRMYDNERQTIENGIRPDVEVTLESKDKDDIIEYATNYIDNL